MWDYRIKLNRVTAVRVKLRDGGIAYKGGKEQTENERIASKTKGFAIFLQISLFQLYGFLPVSLTSFQIRS